MFLLLAALTLVLHANTRLQDYPSPPAIAGEPACWKTSSGGVSFFLRCNLSVFRGHCAPCEVPELPSNVTCGLWFDPQAGRPPQPPSKQIVINGGGEGGVVVFRSHVSSFPMPVCGCEGPVRAEEGSVRLPSGASEVCFPAVLLLHSSKRFST